MVCGKTIVISRMFINGSINKEIQDTPVNFRYGFETPIYLQPDTKISQGEQSVTVAALAPGTPVEVEYNFDINTAKRKAVNVRVSSSSATASAPAAMPAAIPAPASAVAEHAATGTAASGKIGEPATTTAAPAKQSTTGSTAQ